ncbi:MAG: methyltransferase domain-containing protein [Bacteroidia bacterium]
MKTTIKWKLAQKLERLWWKKYLKNQSPEDYKSWKTKYWNKFYDLVKDDIELKTTDTIADLGCGPAGIFTIFNSNKVTAVDPLLDKYEQDLSVFNKTQFTNTQFVTSTIEQFNPQNQFNLVCCLNAINHVSDISASFKKLNTIVAPDGFCLLSIDAHNHKFLKHLFRAIPGDALHPHQYDLAEYEQMLTNVGFKIIKSHLYKSHPIFNYYILLAQKKG